MCFFFVFSVTYCETLSFRYVLGNNFIDNPALRVRFDMTDVMPVFHGPGTLICTAPHHHPGVVPIRVLMIIRDGVIQMLLLLI